MREEMMRGEDGGGDGRGAGWENGKEGDRHEGRWIGTEGEVEEG